MKIAVVGDSCTDRYVYGSCERLSPEGPVPILGKKYQHDIGGMSLNVYNNLVNMIGSETLTLYSNNHKNMEKVRFVDEKTNQLLLRVDINDQCNRISEATKMDIKEKAYDAIVVSDYCKGYMTDEDIIELGMCAPVSFLDSKRKLTKDIVGAFNSIKLNEYECKLNKQLVDKYTKKFVVTLGSKGVMFLNDILPPPKVLQTYDVSGAGDTFLAGIVSRLMQQDTIYNAIDFAQQCANKVIQERGTCVYKKGE